MASPLILRPLACSDGAVGLAVILKTARPQDASASAVAGQKLVLKAKEGAAAEWPVKADLDPVKAAMILGEDGRPLLGKNTDVLLAFMDWL